CVADLGIALRIVRPAGTPRATILVGSGGAGFAFLEADDPGALTIMKELVQGGYIVVSRSWDFPGWFEGSRGMVASSCRYGTLLRWVDENLRAVSAPYCALGISGGSYEVGYAPDALGCRGPLGRRAPPRGAGGQPTRLGLPERRPPLGAAPAARASPQNTGCRAPGRSCVRCSAQPGSSTRQGRPALRAPDAGDARVPLLGDAP